MGLRVLLEALRRRWRAKLVGLLTVASGIAVLGALLHLTAEGGDRLALDLRGYGANLVARGEGGALLRESDVPAIKSIFWRHNVVALAPELHATVEHAGARFPLVGTWLEHDMDVEGGERWRTGQLELQPSWREAIAGAVPRDGAVPSELLVGSRLARARGWSVGDRVVLGRGERSVECVVAGVLRTGDAWEDRALAPLAPVQALLDAPGAVAEVRVGALAKPDDELASRERGTLTAAEVEKLICSPYLSTIAAEIEEAVPGSVVEPANEVARAEGEYLSRLQLVLALLAASAAALTCLGVYGSVRSALLQRREEIGLLRALGARTSAVVGLFLGEGLVVGAAGAVAGTFAGWALAHALGVAVFGEGLAFRAEIAPFLLLAGVALSAVGAGLAVRQALRQDPLALLRAG